MPFILALFCSPLVPDVLGDKRGEVRRHDHSAMGRGDAKGFRHCLLPLHFRQAACPDGPALDPEGLVAKAFARWISGSSAANQIFSSKALEESAPWPRRSTKHEALPSHAGPRLMSFGSQSLSCCLQVSPILFPMRHGGTGRRHALWSLVPMIPTECANPLAGGPLAGAAAVVGRELLLVYLTPQKLTQLADLVFDWSQLWAAAE